MSGRLLQPELNQGQSLTLTTSPRLHGFISRFRNLTEEFYIFNQRMSTSTRVIKSELHHLLQVTGIPERRSANSTTWEFEVSTLAEDGSGFPGGALNFQPISTSSSRLCHREGREVLRQQLVQQEGNQSEDVRPPLLPHLRLHPLDIQQEVPGRQVLAEELERGQVKVHQRLELWSESMRSDGLLLVDTNLRSKRSDGRVQRPLDPAFHRLLSLPPKKVYVVRS